MTATPDLVAEYLTARAERDQAIKRLQEVQDRLIKQMEADQRKSYKWSDGGHTNTVTYVRKRTTLIDEKGLRKALTAKVYDQYTKRVLNRTAMEAAMDTGEVDKVTVSRFVTTEFQRPYLEYRTKEESE